VTPADLKLSNNVFTGNDFGTSMLAYFSPASMVVDGGGNKCFQPSNLIYPLNCSGPATASPVNIITAIMPEGLAGSDYSFNFEAAGGTAPYTWEIISSTHPCCYVGINSTTGVFSNAGTNIRPLQGDWEIVIRVEDAVGNSRTKSFDWDVVAARSNGSCSSSDPFVSLGGGVCVNGGWLPPGHPDAEVQRHPWGSVVVDPTGTVFFLGTDLRYPFPSPEVFFSWGHKFSDVVVANSADLSMPVGPVVQKKP
jgi:hypothetical protein